MFAYNKASPRFDNRARQDNECSSIRAESRLDAQELRLLLIEDQIMDVFLAEEMLENSMPDYKWQVTDKPSMAKALSILHDYKFDIALVDLTLQDMHGADIVTTLRMVAPDLPIVVYTGSSDLDMLRDALSKGAQFCIEKGTTMPKVVRAMLQCVLAPEARY